MPEQRHIDNVLPGKASVITYSDAVTYPAGSLGAAVKARPTLAVVQQMLADYVTLTALNNALANYYTKGQVDAMILGGTVQTATPAEFQANTADRFLDTDTVWNAAAPETVNLGVALDFNTFINGQATLTGNVTLAAPVNGKPGQTGVIILTQDATGGRTVAFNAAWKFQGGVDPVVATAPGAVNILSYFVISAGNVFASLAKDVK